MTHTAHRQFCFQDFSASASTGLAWAHGRFPMKPSSRAAWRAVSGHNLIPSKASQDTMHTYVHVHTICTIIIIICAAGRWSYLTSPHLTTSLAHSTHSPIESTWHDRCPRRLATSTSARTRRAPWPRRRRTPRLRRRRRWPRRSFAGPIAWWSVWILGLRIAGMCFDFITACVYVCVYGDVCIYRHIRRIWWDGVFGLLTWMASQRRSCLQRDSRRH